MIGVLKNESGRLFESSSMKYRGVLTYSVGSVGCSGYKSGFVVLCYADEIIYKKGFYQPSAASVSDNGFVFFVDINCDEFREDTKAVLLSPTGEVKATIKANISPLCTAISDDGLFAAFEVIGKSDKDQNSIVIMDLTTGVSVFNDYVPKNQMALKMQFFDRVLKVKYLEESRAYQF